MQSSAARWSMLALAVAAATACCVWAGRLEQRALDNRRALTASTTTARGLQSALADTRRALSAMASPGQAAVSWSRQATTSIAAARTQLAALMATEGGARLQPHAERLDKLADAEARLRENAVGGRTLMASDVAFGEALPQVDALDHEVAEAVGGMIESSERHLAATRDRQILALAGALGLLGVAAVLLTPLPRTPENAVVAEGSDAPADDLSLALGPSDANAAPIPVSAAVATPAASAPVPAARRLDLPPLAAACDALAQLADADKLPGVLDAVRPALGARGVVVWLAEADRQTLHAVAASGYDARLVARFPVVAMGDDNPTARAFARRRVVTVAAAAGEPAALAMPIAGTRGPTGVLSLEMLSGYDASADVAAAATIVAAQLATLLEPLPTAEAAPTASEAAEEEGIAPIRAELG